MQLTRMHRILAGVVVTGAVVIAGIGFAGSYAAVRDLALDKGFGAFANVFPIGIDAGIVVLLALDLLLTWIRIPFPLLRQTAWLLTAATIAFNGAAAWPDPVGVGMHAVIPILFVVSVEAARHAVGRIADITADRHMESVRIARWLLAPVPTFRLWRRMKLWELRSYEEVIRLEQDRLVYQARLRARYGRSWRRKAPVESLMPLRLARYGVPLADTAPAGLAAAGLEPSAVSPAALPSGRKGSADAAGPQGAHPGPGAQGAYPGAQPGPYGTPGGPAGVNGTGPAAAPQQPQQPQSQELPLSLPLPVYQQPAGQGHDGRSAVPFTPAPAAAHPEQTPQPTPQQTPQEPQDPQQDQQAVEQVERPEPQSELQLSQQAQQAQQHQLTVPVGPGGRVRPLGGEGVGGQQGVYVPEQREPERYAYEEQPGQPLNQLPDDVPREEVYYATFRQFLADHSRYPSAYQFGQRLRETYGVNDLSNSELAAYVDDFKERVRLEREAEAIP
ncbi:DUF2637 domain-containing protein [Streptomyces luomodiensis]|uniref:DUF2637 domain-containing protein n=1 Tax=Streptomyces luomodiensis TaxID=3026192 RepID=A0ABY9V1U6_9ACTN|nr:DUF2637 domain-containing protein [Streptomyces sp. SCA4-21]WNE98040.1 DUF2637 domain-containing protein [Streptomyces sp. SCA4-21]